MNNLHPPCSCPRSRTLWLSLLATFFLLAIMPAFGQVTFPCDDPTCATTSISVNTGFNHNTGLVYPTGVQDQFWTVTADANPANGSVPRPANTIPRAVAWPLPQTGTQWIAGIPTNVNNFIGNVTYERCFCICGTTPVNINYALNVICDDNCQVFIDGFPLGTVPILLQTPTAINGSLLLAPGMHCLRIVVTNAFTSNSGLNVRGTINGANLLRPTCCGSGEIVSQDGECDVRSLSLHSNDTWTILTDPSDPDDVPRCASPTPAQGNWGAAQDSSEWISINATATAPINGTYTFQKCFCVSEETTLQLHVSVMADDELSVIFGGTTILNTSGWSAATLRTVTIPIAVDRGCHCIQFEVRNVYAVVTGLNAVIRLTGQNLLRDSCCYCATCPCDSRRVTMPAPPHNPDHSAGMESAANTKATMRSMLMSVPNPTTGETTFHYVVDRGADVTLELYNMAGERVEVLETGWKDAGKHSVPYDVHRLPAGTYHLRMRFGSKMFSLPVNVQ